MLTNRFGRTARRKSVSLARRRRGAATAELALVLPVMFTLVFGTLEVCQRLLLRESAAVAAYEAARRGARRHATADEAVLRGQSILEGRGIAGGVISLEPPSLVDVPTGGEFQVNVTVPLANNAALSYVLPVSGQITVSATMLRE